MSEDDTMRDQEQAAEDALEHLGEAIDALQDADGPQYAISRAEHLHVDVGEWAEDRYGR